MRNKYSPAIALLTIYKDLSTLEQFLELKNDVAKACVLLEENEATHQSRLDCYKILNHNYHSLPEVFSLRDVIANRISGEESIAKATAGSTQRCDVTFVIDFGGVYDYEVRADLYVFNHLLSNLLSNARKHTFRGEIRVGFAVGRSLGNEKVDEKSEMAQIGETKEIESDLLRFSVRDSGKGMSVKMANELFKTEVATGDTRGTGLGLPSCLIFSEAVGGYCKIASTQLQDSSGEGGFSEFEFGIRGKIVGEVDNSEANEASTGELDAISKRSLPQSLTVVTVEDSPLIRKVLKRTFKSLDFATQNWVFEEFATVEAAQPRLLELANDPMTVVTVDQNMEAMGGVCKGTDLVQWLVEQKFKGMIISSSGDSDISSEHLQHGAHVAWGKPLKREKALADLLDRFAGPDPKKAALSIAARAYSSDASRLATAPMCSTTAPLPALATSSNRERTRAVSSSNLSAPSWATSLDMVSGATSRFAAVAGRRPRHSAPQRDDSKSPRRKPGSLPHRVHPLQGQHVSSPSLTSPGL
jgi:CheY-like chemotaxis protein